MSAFVGHVPAPVRLADVVKRVLKDVAADPAFKRGKGRRWYGLSLSQIEEFTLYTMLVLLGAKDAYMATMAFTPCPRSSGGAAAGLRTLVTAIQRIAAPFVESTDLVCVCVQGPAASEEEGGDYLLLRRAVFLHKLAALSSAGIADGTVAAEDAFACAHPLVVDVNGNQPSTCSLAEGRLRQLLAESFAADTGRAGKAPLELIHASNAPELHAEAGLCLCAGWLLGYPCLYRHLAGGEEQEVANALCMQRLRKCSVVVPAAVVLHLDLCMLHKDEGRASAVPILASVEGSLQQEPTVAGAPEISMLRRAREDPTAAVHVLDFTVPVALLEAAGPYLLESFQRALEQQLGQARAVLGAACCVAYADFTEPNVVM